jgi:hypothetical protein
MNDLQLGVEKKEKMVKLPNNMNNDQFTEGINRIMSEATEYEQEAFVREDEEETQENSEEEKDFKEMTKEEIKL